MPTNDHRNIRLHSSDKNFTFDGVYFYSYNNSTNSLIQKTDDGTVAFTFPVNVSMTQEVKGIHYEGMDLPNSINGSCFWTLEDKVGGGGIVIRRLVADNFLIKSSNINTSVIDVDPITLTLNNNATVTWSTSAFAVEMYETKILDLDEYPGHNFGVLPSANNINDGILRLFDDVSDNVNGTGQFRGSNYPDAPNFRTYIEPTMNKSQQELLEQFKYDSGAEVFPAGVKIIIGPDSNGNYETVISDATPTHRVGTEGGNDLRVLEISISGNLTRGYPHGTPVRVYKNIFVFNDTNGGELVILNDLGNIVRKITSAEYGSVSGAVFSQRERRVVYTKATNAIFLEPDVANIKIVKTSTLDNIETDDITVIPIYDLATSYSGTLFRLQDKQVFNGALESFSGTNNYVVTALFSLAKSITIRPVPQIIAADNIDRSTITATVRDQYNNPVVGVFVTLTEDDATGGPSGQGGVFVHSLGGGGEQIYNGTIEDVLQTDSNGQVKIQYRAGSNNTDVVIGASVRQLVS